MMGRRTRSNSWTRRRSGWLVAITLVVLGAAVLANSRFTELTTSRPLPPASREHREPARAPVRQVIMAEAGSTDSPRLEGPDSPDDSLPKRHPVVIRRPAGPPRIATGDTDTRGQPVTVSCASCHANLPPDPETDSGSDLREFHQGLTFEHRGLACLSCHHADDYNRLRLADSRPLEFSDVQQLCSQCHAPQARDYERGVHGGMQGYWDLTRGPRHRKNCIDCHDPHAPAFPEMIPNFRPRDRFLAPGNSEVRHE